MCINNDFQSIDPLNLIEGTLENVVNNIYIVMYVLNRLHTKTQLQLCAGAPNRGWGGEGVGGSQPSLNFESIGLCIFIYIEILKVDFL